MRSWLTYTAARLGLFAGAFGIVYLFGARSWIALILAWVISGLASYVLLSKWRDQISQNIVERSEQRRGNRLGDRLEDAASREDHLQEAAEEPQQADGYATDDRPAAEGTDPAEAAQEPAGGDESARTDSEDEAGERPRLRPEKAPEAEAKDA
ncbi:DUF4229 domain-containing protein [Nocardiopsis sp. HNM0947]|uniref:DUF4229 domain-containing protein n=1 Tax=Nocardiopsis coralli TaxID=2772213 RepID=A0ABR9P1Y7_9ACTN|nr:DUF4229 domain-containing protein [Nocardiopsis coralli]MBE2997810.1 DUF4229 domain-containing protein [Nocardiopsis coralli]